MNSKNGLRLKFRERSTKDIFGHKKGQQQKLQKDKGGHTEGTVSYLNLTNPL